MISMGMPHQWCDKSKGVAHEWGVSCPQGGGNILTGDEGVDKQGGEGVCFNSTSCPFRKAAKFFISMMRSWQT